MDSYFYKTKSTQSTLETFAANSSTLGHSLFEKQMNQGPNINLSFPSEYFDTLIIYSHFSVSIDQDQPNPFANRLKVNIRQRYILRVLGSQEQRNFPSIKHQHIFIYDWDDTLIFTSHLKGMGFTELNQQTKIWLKQLDQIVCNILNYSLKKGQIFMITNSVNGWVNYSSRLYLPKTHMIILNSRKIKILSARQLFQQIYPNDLKMWKISTFRKLKEYLRTNILTNVICVGDREDDMEACQAMIQSFQHIYIKKIKFQEKPNPQELIKQLKLLEKKFQQIFHIIADTTIKLAKRLLIPQNQRSSSSQDISQKFPPKK